jgi:hypothetical protein
LAGAKFFPEDFNLLSHGSGVGGAKKKPVKRSESERSRISIPHSSSSADSPSRYRTEVRAKLMAKAMNTAPRTRSTQCPYRRNAARTAGRVNSTETKQNQPVVAATIHAP